MPGHRHELIQVRTLAALGIPLVLAGCSSGPSPIKPTEPRLNPVVAAYELAIREAHDDVEFVWQSGWLGNLRVKLDVTGRHRGLCWEWALLTFSHVQEGAVKNGFSIGTISKHVGSFAEHHAIMVFDQSIISPDQAMIVNATGVPDALREGPVWVLDPWKSGRADIFDLHGWLQGACSSGVRVSVLRIASPSVDCRYSVSPVRVDLNAVRAGQRLVLDDLQGEITIRSCRCRPTPGNQEDE